MMKTHNKMKTKEQKTKKQFLKYRNEKVKVIISIKGPIQWLTFYFNPFVMAAVNLLNKKNKQMDEKKK